MEQKTEELYTKIVAAHPRPHFPVDGRVFMVLKYIQKPVMFWKQSEGSKGNFRIRGHRADKQ